MAGVFDIHEVHRISGLEFLAKQVVEGFLTGLHKSPFHGFSVEFAEHRLYNTGESTRHIDWKLYARTEKLFIKRYEEETNLRCQLVIDRSPSMYFPTGTDAKGKKRLSKIDFAVYACAALVHLLKKQRDAQGLTVFSETIETHLPSRASVSHQKLIFQTLEGLFRLDKAVSQGQSRVSAVLHEVAERLPRRSLVVIFSDCLDTAHNPDDMISALRHLRHNHHEVILFHILDHLTELNLEVGDGQFTFRDVETGREIKLFPEQIREEYKSRMMSFANKIKLAAGQAGVDYQSVDAAKGFDHVLLPFLARRSSLL